MKKVLMWVNDPAFFLSHRLPIALKAKASGYQVHIVTGEGLAIKQIKQYGFTHHQVPLSRGTVSLIKDVKTLYFIFLLYLKIKPDLVHHVTVKPVLYGGIAARLCRVPAVVSAISGLGTVYIGNSRKNKLLRLIVGILYRFSLSHNHSKVIVQNKDDKEVLEKLHAITDDDVVLIPGSGVDLNVFKPIPEPEDQFVVLMASRLLKDKGVYEYREAAKILKQRGHDVTCLLAGNLDPGNPTSLSEKELNVWRQEGAVQLVGFKENMQELIAHSSLVVLPSYREGLPKILIEAAACGRAIVTTEVSGCRDAIIPDVTGVLVPPRDAQALADAIEKLIINNSLRKNMGKAGRQLAEKQFSIEQVVDVHLFIYTSLL